MEKTCKQATPEILKVQPPTYLGSYLPTYPNYLGRYLPILGAIYLLTYLFRQVQLLTYLFWQLQLLTYLFRKVPTYLPTYFLLLTVMAHKMSFYYPSSLNRAGRQYRDSLLYHNMICILQSIPSATLNLTPTFVIVRSESVPPKQLIAVTNKNLFLTQIFVGCCLKGASWSSR